MRDFVRSQDTFGKSFQFNINGDTYKSTCVGVFSVLLTILNIYLIWYFGKDLYLLENPDFSEVKSINSNYPVINTDSNSLFFTFKLGVAQNQAKEFSDPRFLEYLLYNFEVDLETQKINKNNSTSNF